MVQLVQHLQIDCILMVIVLALFQLIHLILALTFFFSIVGVAILFFILRRSPHICTVFFLRCTADLWSEGQTSRGLLLYP